MIPDLSGKFVEASGESATSRKVSSEQNSNLEEAMEALLALGYKATE
ncbi:Holliday junction DNA helicase RuvA [Streptococcus agalactiae H36B]|nr:Holliday junction DNA helicase RuvA [Streptococcus agalactiae H36B]